MITNKRYQTLLMLATTGKAFDIRFVFVFKI